MTDNDNLELKKRSRRRLVGAAALALLAAIVLPMVMDQEPDSPAQDIQVTIPDREADSALARPIGGQADSGVEAQVAPPPQEQPPGPQTEAPVPGTAATEAAAGAPAPSATQAPAVPPKPEPSRPVAVEKPADKPSASNRPAGPAADEAARVRALLEGGSSVASASSEAFVVQVGAFSDASKAASISSELKGKGFSAYTEKAGTITRVRIGPFPNRDEAGKAAERLRADGIQGVVTVR